MYETPIVKDLRDAAAISTKSPDVYSGYMGATGNHVRAILDALMPSLGQLTPR